MDPRLPARALVLMLTTLVLALGPARALDAREKLCGHHFVRELVRVCGGPRWSPEAGKPAAGGDRELLQWLAGRHLLHGLVVDGDPALVPGSGALFPVSHRRRRREVASNPARRCCRSGCTHHDLMALCPH
ncbi:Insulin-like 3 [Sciurus carolinensis]|uniref:Insulin-like 3 n=1 Tax=Sciurus carolinensis TaxID=30640 RepID=A0AA41MI76_SCICA|nr:insulin-like 3 [Sciurus carolinensis]MBZ3872419.1 Insulin-like 3 [Sciurus carolinensis]